MGSAGGGGESNGHAKAQNCLGIKGGLKILCVTHTQQYKRVLFEMFVHGDEYICSAIIYYWFYGFNNHGKANDLCAQVL